MNDAAQVGHGRIFRGWYVAATLAVCGVALYGAGLYSFILFVTPLSNEFHWSRAATGSLVSAFWLAAPLVLYADRLIARFGVRRLIVAGILVESLALIFLFTASHLWQMYLLRAIAGLGKILYAICVPVLVSRWFSRRFSLALAVVYAGWQVGGLVLAPITQDVLDALGWRAASATLGAAILLIALPPVLRVLRVPSAAAAGLGLDGIGPPATDTHAPGVKAAAHDDAGGRSDFSLVLRDPAFLLVSIGMFIYCLSYGGTLAHQAAAVQAAGLSSHIASLVVSGTAGIAIAGAFLIGWLADHYPLVVVTLVQYALTAIGILCLFIAVHVTPSLWLLAGHAACFGLSIGGIDVFWNSALKRRVPQRLFVKAYGMYYFGALISSVLGPVFAGYLYDRTGGYTVSLGACALNLVIPFIMSLALARRPTTA